MREAAVSERASYRSLGLGSAQSRERVAERDRLVPDVDLFEAERAPLGHAHRVHQADVKPLVCGPNELFSVSELNRALWIVNVAARLHG